MSTPPELRVHPLGGRLGAEVTGLFLATRLPRGLLEALKDALQEHRLLVVRHQHLDDAAHLAFARCFGAVPADLGPDADPAGWVVPGSYRLAPPKALSLRAAGPVRPGSVTFFADAVGAYRDLPRPLRALADRSWALHQRSDDATGPVAHPVTRLHPETGDRALLLGSHARQVMGLDPVESRTVLRLLHPYVRHARNVLRWSWSEGDVLLLDSRSVLVRRATTDGRPAPVVQLAVDGERPLGVDGRHSYRPGPAELRAADACAG